MGRGIPRFRFKSRVQESMSRESGFCGYGLYICLFSVCGLVWDLNFGFGV